MDKRLLTPKDLGEIMVLGHAAVQAETGADVIVLIDDGDGAKLARLEIARLDRLRESGQPVGNIQLVGTHTILARAAGGDHIKDKVTMRSVYQRMRDCDDGLVEIKQTNLLSPTVWPSPA